MQLNHSPMSLQSSANLNLWVALIVVSIFHHNSLRNRSKLTRSALLEPKLAPWEKLLNHGDNQSFLEVTGFTWRAFMKLERVLFPDSNLSTANYRRGRPSGLNNRGKVGLYLLYVNSSMRSKHSDTMCNNVFAFAPTGKIIYACINFPGSWHDSQVSVSLIDKVITSIGDYAFCVDQGFPRSGELYDKFVGPMSRKIKRNLSPRLRELVMIKQTNI
jgi:hypothetical protein